MKEEKILNLINKIYKEFNKLERQHPSEKNDFIEGIHKCQYVIAMRLARIAYPKLFPKK